MCASASCTAAAAHLLLADLVDQEAYSEWMDSFYARDVQECSAWRNDRPS